MNILSWFKGKEENKEENINQDEKEKIEKVICKLKEKIKKCSACGSKEFDYAGEYLIPISQEEGLKSHIIGCTNCGLWTHYLKSVLEK